jgi:hypothetical protein
MTTTKKTPPIVQLGAWLLSLIVFIVGFWHTHLGLKEMRPFGSEYGSIAIAGIILLLLLITYWFAVNGKKMALIFYIICGLFFFVFNLNYFYPAYMGRTLIKEEASALKDTINAYSKIKIVLKDEQSFSERDKLIEIKNNIVKEMNEDSGFGQRAKQFLNDFNSIAGTGITPPLKVNQTQEYYSKFQKRLEDEIDLWTIRNSSEGSTIATANAEGKTELEGIRNKYVPILDTIATDDSELGPLDSVKYTPQVQNIKECVEAINNSVRKINKGNNKLILKELNKETHPRADKLGKIKHTLTSISERIGEIDTWGIILVCLFIDLLVPLAIYFLLKKDENEVEDTRLKGRNRPTQF